MHVPANPLRAVFADTADGFVTVVTNLTASWPGTSPTSAVNASSRTPSGTRGRAGDSSTESDAPCAPGFSLLTDRQRTRLESVFTADERAAVEII